MEIQPLGKRNMLIYIEGEELGSLSVQPCDIKTDDAAEILKAALGGGCGEKWENVYLELYAGRDSLLLFARAHSGDPYYFMFGDIEGIILASKGCPEDIISYLVYYGGVYYLIVYPWEKEMLPGALYEYGQLLTMHPYYTLYLSEHGKTLLGPTALGELKSLF